MEEEIYKKVAKSLPNRRYTLVYIFYLLLLPVKVLTFKKITGTGIYPRRRFCHLSKRDIILSNSIVICIIISAPSCVPSFH